MVGYHYISLGLKAHTGPHTFFLACGWISCNCQHGCSDEICRRQSSARWWQNSLLFCSLWKMVIFTHEHMMSWSIALSSLQYSVVQQEEERAGWGGFPRLPPSWGCWSVNLCTLGLKGPSVNDLWTLILVWAPLLKVLFAVWAASLSAVLLGVSIFMAEPGSRPLGVLRHTCWGEPQVKKTRNLQYTKTCFFNLWSAAGKAILGTKSLYSDGIPAVQTMC